MVDVYLLRHAHVDYTPPAQITQHVPLTPLGKQMAERLAERCCEWDLQYLFASPMRRARQTADAISRRLPDLPRLDLVELQESCLRDLEGFPGELPPEDMHTWEDAHYAYANARMWERIERVWTRITSMIEIEGLERVAVVSHGGPINALLRRFLGEDVVRLRTCWFYLDWSTTSCLRYTDAGRWIRWVNDSRHIDALRELIPAP